MHVLLVEDEPRLATIVRKGLNEQGYAVDIASGGEEALDWVDTNVHDVIVLDIMLPDIDGLEVCRRLRKQRVQTPILLLTAKDAISDRVAGLDAGADDYLVKPFAFSELAARLRALTRRPPEMVET
ncbi:MAG: response regulator, partial [Thermomicrobiales bacterium]